MQINAANNMPFQGRQTLSEYFAGIFPGKVQKIAINAGLGCPNRDGTLGSDGCCFCNNAAFNPPYAFGAEGSISAQLEAGAEFFARKGRTDGFLPYFQSYSGTYGETSKLIDLYEEALRFKNAVGLVIATRPDCLAPDLLDYFESRFSKNIEGPHPYLLLEIGVESTLDSTLHRIGRGHDFACSQRAIRQIAARGIDVGAHIILGLPGECDEDYVRHAELMSELPLTTLKLHQLQIIKGTRLAGEYSRNPQCFKLFSPEGYARAVKLFLQHLRSDIILDRFVSESPRDLLIAPSWGLKPSEWQQLFERQQ